MCVCYPAGKGKEENETTEDEETDFDQGWSSESSDDTDSDSNQEALGANVGNGSESYDEIHFESTDEETNSDNGQLASTKKAWLSRRLHIPFSIAYTSTQYTIQLFYCQIGNSISLLLNFINLGVLEA